MRLLVDYRNRQQANESMTQTEVQTIDEAIGEIRRLRDAMNEIIRMQPCCDGGFYYYPMHDCDGNYIGEQNVDPVTVMQAMAQKAQNALNYQ